MSGGDGSKPRWAAMHAAENVIRGWLGQAVPSPIKHRNATRAAYRKTEARRPRRKVER